MLQLCEENKTEYRNFTPTSARQDTNKEKKKNIDIIYNNLTNETNRFNNSTKNSYTYNLIHDKCGSKTYVKNLQQINENITKLNQVDMSRETHAVPFLCTPDKVRTVRSSKTLRLFIA